MVTAATLWQVYVLQMEPGRSLIILKLTGSVNVGAD